MIKTQKGFALVESLLILMVVAIIGGTGYYVWHSRKQTNKTLSETGNSTQTPSKNKSSSNPPATTPATKIVEVKEWGVKFVDKSGWNLSYKISDSHHLTLTNPELLIDSSCNPPGSTGYILRYLPDEDVDLPAKGSYPATTTTAQQQADIAKSNNNSSTIKFINGYYYMASYLNGNTCGNTKQIQQLSTNIATYSLSSIVPTLSAL